MADDLLLKHHQLLALEPVPRRDWLSVFNWIYGYKPLYNGTYDFIYHRDDFVSIANRCRNGFDEFIETCVSRWPEAPFQVFVHHLVKVYFHLGI